MKVFLHDGTAVAYVGAYYLEMREGAAVVMKIPEVNSFYGGQTTQRPPTVAAVFPMGSFRRIEVTDPELVMPAQETAPTTSGGVT